MVLFHTVTFSFDFPSNFILSLVATRFVVCLFFSCLDVLRKVKRVLAFPEIFSVDPGRSIKLREFVIAIG